jgi:hypothetical protein
MRCLDLYARIMAKTEGRMFDVSDLEQAAHAAALAPLGDFVGAKGMERPLATYSRDEILELIGVVVAAYRAHLVTEHERLASQAREYFRARLDAVHGKDGVPY